LDRERAARPAIQKAKANTRTSAVRNLYMQSSTVKIVLVRPRDPNNIGAVARAMKNFGFSDLWIVTPHPPSWTEVVSAVNAMDVLTEARPVRSLGAAIADCNLVVGTADRTRVEEKQTFFTPLDLNDKLRGASYKLALVFGSEKHGLTNEELSHCHHVMSIPTQPGCPSMNLGQAVAVCCYELVRERAQSVVEPQPAETATAGATEAALNHLLETMRLIDFILPGNEPGLTRRLRSGLMRFNLTKYDVEMLCGVLSRINRGLEK
jgi:tRNA/rRNA methyltransferase